MKVDYSDIAANYDKHRSYSEEEIRKIIEFGGIGEGMRVLDLGCGTGNVSSQIQQYVNADIVAADKSLPMLEKACSKSLAALCVDADAGCLPFRDNTFDIVMAVYVIHQIDNLKAMLSECYRILRNGRLLIITSSHRQIESEHPVYERFFPSFTAIDKARFPDIPVLDSYLESLGFNGIRHDVIHVENVPLDDTYLQKVKGKYVSTYHLIPENEFRRGVVELEKYIRNSHHTELMDWQATLLRADKDG